MFMVMFMLIIIPAYNPDHHLINVLKDLKGKIDHKILIVNDGSSEDSNEVFSEAKKYAIVINHDINKGKGRAMKTALEYVRDNFPDEDGVVFVDADGQHKAKDVKKLIDSFEKNNDSLILGVRVFDKDVPFKSRMGNKITRTIFKIFTSKYISDTQTGLRAISTKFIPFLLRINGDRYEYEMNMLIDAVAKKIDVLEVPIETVYEDKKNKTSHFRAFRDSFLVYKVFLKFSMSSVSCIAIDYVSFLIFLGIFVNAASMIFLSNVLARVISATVNFNINNRVVFKYNGKHKCAIQYFSLATGIILVNSLILYLFTSWFGIIPAIAKLIVDLMLFFVNFTIQHKYIFKDR